MGIYGRTANHPFVKTTHSVGLSPELCNKTGRNKRSGCNSSLYDKNLKYTIQLTRHMTEDRGIINVNSEWKMPTINEFLFLLSCEKKQCSKGPPRKYPNLQDHCKAGKHLSANMLKKCNHGFILNGFKCPGALRPPIKFHDSLNETIFGLLYQQCY